MRRSGAREQELYQEPNEPGIYETGRVVNGKTEFVACGDSEERSAPALGNEGYWELEGWLRQRGHVLSATALFLLTGLGAMSFTPLEQLARRTAYVHFLSTGRAGAEFDVYWPRAVRH